MKEFVNKLIGRLEEKFKYNSEQAEIYRDGSDKDAYFREKKDLYMDRANTYGEVMRIVNQLAEEYKNTNIITDFLQYARDNADNYDTNEGWSLADLIDLSIKYSEEYINTSTDTSSGYCEWKPIDEEKSIYKSVCKKQSLYDGNPTESMYEFCPYCGKKIKVVE